MHGVGKGGTEGCKMRLAKLIIRQFFTECRHPAYHTARTFMWNTKCPHYIVELLSTGIVGNKLPQ